MNNEIIKKENPPESLIKLILNADYSGMTEKEKAERYLILCKNLNLFPDTKPFEFIKLNDKLVLYPTRACTDQLRNIHNISIEIIDRQTIDNIYIVIAKATYPDGRYDIASGAIALEKEEGEWTKSQTGKQYFKKNGQYTKLRGDDLANAIMKAETKAKRRVTLSICGLSMPDETELETIQKQEPISEEAEYEVIDKKPLLNAMKNAKQEVKITTRPYSLEQLIKFRDTDRKLWNTKLLTEKELTEINIVLNKIVNNVDAKRKALIKFFFGVDSSKDISAGGMEFLFRLSGYMNKEKKKVFDWQPSDVIIEEAQTIFEFMLDNNEVETEINNNEISKYEEIFGVDDDK